jgi:3-oxoacyl-[acyl-carrier-protein] synthase III
MIGKMLIESLGVYLPERTVSTDEVLRGCRVNLRFPLERVTGIQSRHVAGEGEFSVDLAQKAAVDCLSRSKYAPDQIDLVISCDTSHSIGFLRHSTEPSTALRLVHALGLSNARAFDVTNACAGVFTALLIVQCLLETGAIKSALVVSGEHITHLVRTAQLEIENFRDPRLACLTLGDAGVALVVEHSPDGRAGFDGLALETLGQHSALCVGKQTDRRHGGAIMLTDSGELARVAIEESVNRTLHALRTQGWFPGAFQHCIMHQTAKIAVDEVMRVLNRKSGLDVLTAQNTINNLKRRGNTASTTHFVALMDHIRSGHIESEQRIVFGIAASGLTSGTALYTLDNLPERLRRGEPGRGSAPGAGRNGTKGANGAGLSVNGILKPAAGRVRIESVGLVPCGDDLPCDASSMLAAAAESCLFGSRYARHQIELTINTGVYRNEFLCEPAVASIVAGRLRNGDGAGAAPTLAFDLTGGALGTLQACYVAANMIAAGKVKNAMVMAAEIEINRGQCPSRRLGLEETASALILESSSATGPGFGPFHFQSFTRHLDSFTSHSAVDDGKTVLCFEKTAAFEAECIECICDSVDRLLVLEGLCRSQVAALLPPLVSTPFVSRLAEALGVPLERVVQPPKACGDLYTSSLACALKSARESGRVRPGDLGLIVGVGSGIQVGCAIYYF